jgi:hypothetical protein
MLTEQVGRHAVSRGGGRGCEPNPDPGKLGSYKKIGEGTGEAAHGSIDDSAILFFLSVCVFSSACASSCRQ